MALHREVLADQERLLGPEDQEHEQVVFGRMNICKFLGGSGRLQEAVDGYEELLPLVTRVRGAYHPNTFLVQLNIESAVGLLRTVVADRARVLGQEHRDTLGARRELDGLLGG